MRRIITSALAALLPLAGTAQAQEPKTFFDYVESVYVVGRLNAAPPLKYRDGTVLVFTTKVLDITHARVGNPQTLMLVQELRAKDEAPPFKPDVPFLAPVLLLPEHAYWRDNLPNTPRHQIVGGTRYIFTGDQMAEVEKYAKPFAATLDKNYTDRWPDRADAIVNALASSLTVIREDAARYLVAHPVLFANVREPARAKLSAYLTSDAPIEFRQSVVAAMGAEHPDAIMPLLEELSRRDDAIGAAALRALDHAGKPQPVSSLLDLEKASSPAVRAYAIEALAAQASTDKRAFEAAVGILSSDAPPEVRAAAAVGLGRSQDSDAVPALSAALAKGDRVAKPAAAALAAIGGPDAVDALKKTVAEGKGEAGVAAVVALVDVRGQCADCTSFLEKQHESNPEKSIRDMIGIMLELNRKHEH